MIETKRLKIYPASKEQMEAFIATQSVPVLKNAYMEMLNSSLAHPVQWEWYAIWMIELKDGTHIGELCFKGLSEDRIAEIGYGIAEDKQGCGYATEAVSALADWALKQPGVVCIKAETEESNIASKRVLENRGLYPRGKSVKKVRFLCAGSRSVRKNIRIIKISFHWCFVLLRKERTILTARILLH